MYFEVNRYKSFNTVLQLKFGIFSIFVDNRGFMTANGQPDNPRSARYVLKDFVNGKLLYAHAPPNIDQKEYHTWPERKRCIPLIKQYHLEKLEQ